MATDKQIWFSVKLVVIVVCLEIGTTIKAQWVVDDDGCRTPNRGVGTCISIRECKPMLDYIRSQQTATLSPDTIEVLQRYQCGFEGNSVKVCCPDGPIVIKKPNQPVNLMPPDVSTHRNLNLLPDNCGLPFNNNRITGGNKTELFEFPWMALLSYQIGGGGVDFRCGGTVISPWYILTAAHCITNLSNLKLVGVRVGEYNISSTEDCETPKDGDKYCAPPVQDIAVGEAIPHPGYNASIFINDIGLIRLASAMDTSVDSVKPICLPTSGPVRNLNFVNTNLTVTGWGATETGRRSPDLLKVDIGVISEPDCQQAYKNTSAVINHRQICAGGKNKRDSCGGDSGGPLQKSDLFNNDIRYLQYGVVSFGPRFCGQEGFPGVYTKVEYYLDWILDNMKP